VAPSIELTDGIHLLQSDPSNSVYYIDASVNSLTYSLLIDTASPITWIHPDLLSAVSQSKDHFNLMYSGNTVSGWLVNETFSWNSLEVQYSFGWSNSSIFENYTDGVLALPLNSSLINDLYQQNRQVDQEKFALLLSEKQGLMFLGSNAEKYQQTFTNESTIYCPITPNPNNFWLVDCYLNDNKTSFPTIIDTGTTGIAIPLDQSDWLHYEMFGSNLITDKNGNYAFPCNYTASFNLTLGQDLVQFQVESDQFQGNEYQNIPGYCASKIQGIKNTNYWILGQTFLKNYYTIFDLEKSKIGFSEIVTKDYKLKHSTDPTLSIMSVTSVTSVTSVNAVSSSSTMATVSSTTTSMYSNSTGQRYKGSSSKISIFLPINIVTFFICICILL
jgi:hypothetical protein